MAKRTNPRGDSPVPRASVMGPFGWPVTAAVLVGGLAWFLPMTALTMVFRSSAIVWVGVPWGAWLALRLGQRLGFTERPEFAAWYLLMAGILGATAAGLWGNAPAGGVLVGLILARAVWHDRTLAHHPPRRILDSDFDSDFDLTDLSNRLFRGEGDD